MGCFMQGNVGGYRQGASGAHPVFARQIYRRQPSVMGPLHRGFGFNPEGILTESKDVARRRADEADSLRRAAQSVSLQGQESGERHPAATRGFGILPAGGYDQPGVLVQTPPASRAPAPETRLDWQEAPRTPTMGQLSRARPVVDFEHGAPVGSRLGEGAAAIADVLPSAGGMRSPEREFTAQNLRSREVPTAPAAALTGRQPGRVAVAMGVFVDSAVCFALLTLANLGAHLGNWAGRLRFLTRELSATVGLPALPDEVWHWVIVLMAWAGAVYAVQWAFALLVRSTIGRFLAGIAVDPVASRSRGAWSLPAAEVLSFGGLFIVPLLWIKTDRHPLLRALRFHVPPG